MSIASVTLKLTIKKNIYTVANLSTMRTCSVCSSPIKNIESCYYNADNKICCKACLFVTTDDKDKMIPPAQHHPKDIKGKCYQCGDNLPSPSTTKHLHNHDFCKWVCVDEYQESLPKPVKAKTNTIRLHFDVDYDSHAAC